MVPVGLLLAYRFQDRYQSIMGTPSRPCLYSSAPANGRAKSDWDFRALAKVRSGELSVWPRSFPRSLARSRKWPPSKREIGSALVSVQFPREEIRRRACSAIAGGARFSCSRLHRRARSVSSNLTVRSYFVENSGRIFRRSASINYTIHRWVPVGRNRRRSFSL